MKDYTQKIVYLGIDVHKKTYAVAAICDNEIVKRDTLEAYPDKLVSYIKKYFAGAQVYTAYEAGFCGFHLHRYLEANQIPNIVVHAASIEVSARDRVKTDKRDALKISQQLSSGKLKGIKVPSEEREQRRTLTRTRDAILGAKQRAGNQLKSLLFLHGLMPPEDDTKVCKSWIKRVQGYELPGDLKYCVNMYAQLWLDLEAKLAEMYKKIEEQAKEDPQIDAVYRMVPGIGPLSARILSNELGDMRHFRSEKALFSFTGLTPSEHSSGEHRWLGRISRQGSSLLRKILVQIAWRAITQDKRLAEVFERISKKAGKKKAIVAVARKLIGCIRSCFMNGEVWRTNAPAGEEPVSVSAEAC